MIKKLILSLLITTSIIGGTATSASAKWKVNFNGAKSWEENSANVTGWHKIDGEWYNFGNNGFMQTGWMKDNGNWYYCWSNGMMANRSWMTNGGYWYYFDQDGKMVTDKVRVEDNIYDFTSPTIIYSESVNKSNQNK
ncbi:phage tail protein [Clostridium weizhouense]|uniref:Phage tail protein n=1 Tax=Clostridium weizhouense TaxID=2859781 RepID=A0ABS7APN7_9CLOT|nr:phage tail protein [Clostridium weizhouense]MBW6410577.1 phage tail protein [Clostridium weizhouense]